MTLADYLIIAAILISAAAGAMRGFLREAVALGAWIVALFLAWHFADVVEPHLGGLLAGSEVRPWAARAIIVVLVLILGAFIGALLSHFVRLSIFSGMDRLRGFVLLGVFVILGQLLQLPAEGWWRHSLMIPYGESIANGLRSLVGEPHVAHGREQRT